MGAVRYKSEFQSLAGRKYVVNIWDDEWEGSTGEFCLGPEGFELSYEGNTSEIFKPFIPSRLEFKFNVKDNNGEAFIIDLAQSEPSKFRVFITDSPASGDGDETLFWQGFVQGEGVSITDEYFPYEVNLSAGDIGFFKDIDYVPATGESTIVDTMIAILEQTDHAAFVTDGAHAYDEMFVTTMNWWGINMASGGDPSDKVGINERAWTDYDKANAPLFANCQDVVESVCKLFGCRFFQANGKFYLQQIDAISDGSTREWIYDLNKTLVSDNLETKTIEVDRVDLFQMAGGSTTFAPGLKSVEREHKFTRNYLAGKTANQDAPLDLTIGAIPIFNYTVVGVVPYYQLKFKVTYRNIGNPAIFDPTKAFVPVWRMRFYGEGVTSGETWNYKRDILQQAEAYATAQDEYQFWQQLRFYTIEYKGWVTNTASGNPAYEADRYWMDITHPALASVVQTPNGPEVSFTFDAIIPKFGDPAGAGESAENLYIKFDMYGIYGVDGNDNFLPVYLNNDTDPGTDWGNYFQWRIEEMELYMLPTYSGYANIDEPQANPITAKKYKVESPTNFRKKTEADDCKLIAFDRRTLNAVLTWNGTQFTDSQQWNRGAFNISGARSLNYLSIQEILAHNRIGMRMYQGAVVKKNDMRFGYDAVIEKNSIKYLPLQAAYNAVQDEWRNLTMIELDRDDSGLVYSEVVAEGAGTGGAGTGTGITGGTWVSQPTASGGELIEYLLPNYEFASGQNGSTYTLNDIDLAALSGAPDSLVNRSLMVFQDATKLNYPLGYTVDWATSEITFTYELEDATLEIYYYG